MKAHPRLLAFVLGLFGTTAIPAQTVTWRGTTDNLLNTLLNWSDTPTGADLSFGSSGYTFIAVNSINVNSLSFSGTYPSYTFFSQTSEVLGLGAGGINVAAQTGSFVSFRSSLGIELQANQTWTVNGSLGVSSMISSASPFTLTKAGTGELTLYGTNSFAGGITVQQGRLSLGNDQGAGTGPISIASGATLGTARSLSNSSVGLDLANDIVLGSAGTGNNVTLTTRVTSGGDEPWNILGTVTAGDVATTVHLGGKEPLVMKGTITGPANTKLVFDSATGETSGVVFSGTFNANITSATADGAAMFFITTPPASIQAINHGYIGVAATGTTTLAPSLVLSHIAAADRPSFAGTFGFDTDDSLFTPVIITENLNFSAFTHADFRIGSMTSAVLTGAITPPTSGSTSAYRFGGSSGNLIVKSDLADAPGAPASVLVETYAGGDAPAVVLYGNNTYSGSLVLDGITAQMGVARGIAVLASPTALPSGAASKFAFGAASPAYIGYTEAAGFSTFGDFTSHLATGGYNSLSILGLDSDDFLTAKIAEGEASNSYTPRQVNEVIDLRSFNSVYLGSATDVVINNTVFAPNGGQLKLTAAEGGDLTVTSAFGSNVTNVVLGFNGSFSEKFGNGAIHLLAANTYAGGTVLKSGTLVISDRSTLNDSNAIVSSPIGTGSLIVQSGGVSPAVLTVASFGGTLYNPILLNGSLQLGAPVFSSDRNVTSPDTNLINVAGTISGLGALNIFGVVNLQGNNTYSGGTSVDFGRVNFSSASAFGSGQIVLNGGGGSVSSFVALSSDNSVTLANPVSMSGQVTLGSTSGTLELAGAVTMPNGAAISVLSNGGPVTISGAISGPNLFTLNIGSLTLSGANSYSGGTRVNAGSLIFSNAASVPASGLITSVAGYVGAAFATNLQTGFLDHFDKPTTGGTIGFDSPSAVVGALDFTGFNPAIRIGSASSGKLSGLISPASVGSDYKFGNGGGTLTVVSSLGGDRGLSVVSNPSTPLTLVLSGANTYAGMTSSEGSVLRLDSSTALPATSVLYASNFGYIGYTENTGLSAPAFIARFSGGVGPNAIIGFDSAIGTSPQTISSAISLAGLDPSTYVGSSTNVTLTGSITPAGSTLSLTGVKGGSLVVNSAITSTSLIVGTPNKALSVDGAVTLNSASTFTGGTTLKYGRLILGNASALGTGGIIVNSDGSSLSTNTPGFTLPNAITFATTSSDSTAQSTAVLALDAPNNFTLSGVISGSGGLSKSGAGSVTLSAINSAFEGLIEIYGGNLTFSTNDSAGSGGLAFSSSSGATATFLSAAPSIGHLSGYNPLDQIALAAGSTLTVKQDHDDDFYGTFSGTGAKLVLENANPGTDTYLGLHGSNTYTGGTKIGPDLTVVAANNGALGSTGPVELNGGTLAVHSGVTLTFQSTANHNLVFNDGRLAGNGTFSFDSNVTLHSSSTTTSGLSPGLQNSIGTLNLSFNSGAMLILGGGGEYHWKLTDPANPAAGWDKVVVAGQVDITATAATPFNLTIGTVDANGNTSFVGNMDLASTYSWTILTATSITGFDPTKFVLDTSGFMNFGTFSLTDDAAHTSLILNFNPSAVPEPSTWALLLTGLAVLGFTVRRRRK